jgi:hypothetical protein
MIQGTADDPPQISTNSAHVLSMDGVSKEDVIALHPTHPAWINVRVTRDEDAAAKSASTSRPIVPYP